MTEAYERLKAQYNAAIDDRDRWKAMYEALANRPALEMTALVCDGQCSRAIVGHSEEAVYAEAKRRAWVQREADPSVFKDFCSDCAKDTK